MLTIANAPSTGDSHLDWLIGIVASLLGIGGVTKISVSAWLHKALDKFRDIKAVVAEISANKQEIAELKAELATTKKDLRAALDLHIENDAVEAMIYMGFVEAGEEAMIVQNEKGDTILISPALCRLMGLSKDEAVNGAWKDIIHDDDRARAIGEWRTFVSGNLSQVTIKFRFVRSEKQPAIVSVSLKMVRKKVSQGGVVRLVGLVSLDSKS